MPRPLPTVSQRLRTVGHGGRRPLFLQRGWVQSQRRNPCVWNGGRAGRALRFPSGAGHPSRRRCSGLPGSVPADIQRPAVQQAGMAARSAGDAGRPGAGAPCPEAAQPLRRPWSSLSCLLLNCVTAGLLIWCSSWSWGSVRLETAWLLCLPPLLLAAVTAAFLFRQRRTVGGSRGRSPVRSPPSGRGSWPAPWNCPGTHDLSQAADDLNHIQQGLQAAMEEQHPQRADEGGAGHQCVP